MNNSGADNYRKRKNYFKLDLIILILWLVLMWGFLAILSFVDSPTFSPGIHEVVTLLYFFGMSFVFLFLYIFVVKNKI